MTKSKLGVKRKQYPCFASSGSGYDQFVVATWLEQELELHTNIFGELPISAMVFKLCAFHPVCSWEIPFAAGKGDGPNRGRCVFKHICEACA